MSRPFLSSVLQTMFWTIELKLPLNLQSRFCRPCTLPGITSRCVMENWRDWGRINHFTNPAASWRMVKQWQLTLKKQVCNTNYDYLVTKLPSFATSGALKVVNARHATHKVSRRGKKERQGNSRKMSAQMCLAERKNMLLKRKTGKWWWSKENDDDQRKWWWLSMTRNSQASVEA